MIRKTAETLISNCQAHALSPAALLFLLAYWALRSAGGPCDSAVASARLAATFLCLILPTAYTALWCAKESLVVVPHTDEL
jgi:hypothetical protein